MHHLKAGRNTQYATAYVGNFGVQLIKYTDFTNIMAMPEALGSSKNEQGRLLSVNLTSGRRQGG